jgi:tRNA-dihydrouridine synthase C
MDGITDRTFRDLVLDLGHAGGACTEFVRISVGPVARKVLRRELGDPPRRDVPVGVQLMAPDPEFVAESAARAEEAGAAFIDLNFGCPVRRVVNKCAGSALLAHPDRLGAIVAEAVSATALPVTAKIRAGIADDAPLDDVLDACAGSGAAAVTVHARLRSHSYAEPARWEWIARAVGRLRPRGVAVIGNGGIDRGDDAARMMRETGCAAVMVGRAALADPFVFREARGGPPATREEAAEFALRFLGALCPPGGGAAGLSQFKRLVAVVRAGGLFEGREDERRALLRSNDPSAHRGFFASAASVTLSR